MDKLKPLEDNEVIRIEKGLNQIGREVVRLQTDQQFAKFRLGSYEKDPVRKPCPGMSKGFCRQTGRGWFYPSDSLILKLTSYHLCKMGAEKLAGLRQTMEYGILQVTEARIKIDENGYSLERPEKPYPKEAALPGESVLHVSHIQDASTAMADKGNVSFEEVFKEAVRQWNKDLTIQKAGGGKKPVLEECCLRNALHLSRFYELESFMEEEAIRDHGIQYLKKMEESAETEVE